MNRGVVKYFLSLFLGWFLLAEANIRMGVVSDSQYWGEREVGWRIKLAGESLGWTVFLDENRGCDLRKIKDLDWVICLLPNNNSFMPICPNYLTIFHPLHYLDEDRKLISKYERYEGYLFTIKNGESIGEFFKLRNKKLHATDFYPTVHPVPYQKILLNTLMTMVPVWGNRIMDKKFKSFYQLLSETGVVSFYGHLTDSTIISKGYIGTIPFDGTSVIDVLQRHGIVLIIHSDLHNKEEIPSSRIFEAAAASTVIICDENAFVKEHFGDTVFYIDTMASAESMLAQVQSHLNFIDANPEVALEMAKKAHEIFDKKFLMTDQLLKLEELHNRAKLKMKKIGRL